MIKKSVAPRVLRSPDSFDTKKSQLVLKLHNTTVDVQWSPKKNGNPFYELIGCFARKIVDLSIKILGGL